MSKKSVRGPLSTRTMYHSDILRVAYNMGDRNAEECRKHGLTPKHALEMGFYGDGETWTAVQDETPIGCYGYDASTGTIWSLWTELDMRQQLAILRETEDWITEMVTRSKRPYLWNNVWAGNDATIRWLQLSGCFQFGNSFKDNEGDIWHRFHTHLRFASHV